MSNFNMSQLGEKEVALLKAAGDPNENIAFPAQVELTKAVAEEFYKEGVFPGDIVSNIFTGGNFDEDVPAEYILDLIAPGTENDWIAWYMPDTGHVPERTVNMNKVIVPTKAVAASINCPLKFLRQKRVDILGRMMEALEASFIMRDNLDAFSTLMAAGTAHSSVNGTVVDGVFDFAQLRAMKLAMRRNGGGNSSSVKRHILTDIYLSPEAGEDVRQLVHDVADDFTRKRIADLVTMDGFNWQGVNWNVIDELGVGQLFQKVWTNVLGQSLTAAASELVIGLNISAGGKKNFVNPKRRALEMFEDKSLHRRQEFGWYSWKERGWGVLDTLDVIIGDA